MTNIRLLGGPCDGQVIALEFHDEERSPMPSGINIVQAVYKTTGYYEPFTNNKLYLWEKTTQHDPIQRNSENEKQ